MMKHLQRIGKALMVPVACLPAAGILYGIGYWIDPTGWGANSIAAAFFIKAGAALIDHIPLLFAVGVSFGMAPDKDGTAALAGLVSWLMITTLLSSDAVALYQGVDPAQAPAAFAKIRNPFIGILAGLIGAGCYNRFHSTRLPDWLAFFSGRRCVAIVTAGVSLLVAAVLYWLWPTLYSALVIFGLSIVEFGPLGAGVYAMLNRAMIPFGLHHALNAVFWFDTAGINDLGNFWAGTGIRGVTGMYMTGFFPIMMFGLVAGALAMYHTARPERKKAVASLLAAGAMASFFTGVTEPLEFSFMFMAPGLYFLHALLTGLSVGLCAALPIRCGFNFSAGLVDYVLSFRAPMAVNPLWILPIGLAFGVVYYFLFRTFITFFNLPTPGRAEGLTDEGTGEPAHEELDNALMAVAILEGLGGMGNLRAFDYCATRIRAEVDDYARVDEGKLKAAGVLGVVHPSRNTVQVVVGTRVQFICDEMKRLL